MPTVSSLLDKPRLVEKLRAFYNYVQKNDGKNDTFIWQNLNFESKGDPEH